MIMDETKKDKKKTLVLLDTHALIHRAFHALPPLTSPNGEPVGAVYGVANVILKIIKELEPDYIAAAFDRPEPTFRHEVYKAYKAQRAEAPPDLIRQFDAVRNLCDAFGIRVYDKARYEADDIIGTLAAEAQKTDDTLRIVIASGDLDMLQLVDDDRVVVFTLRKGVADTMVYDEKAVRERFGFAPNLLPDFKGLKGDPSDNIKGVPGVGEKTASALIQACGSLENIYEALSRSDADKKLFKGKLPSVLLKHKDDAYASRDLARIRCDVPLLFSLSEIAWRGMRDRQKADSFLEQLGFMSLRSRLALVRFGDDNAQEEKKDDADGALLGTRERAVDAEFFAKIRGGTVAWMRDEQKTNALYMAVGHDVRCVDANDFAAVARSADLLFSPGVRHIAFNGKEVLKILRLFGVANARVDFDVGIAAWVLNPSLRDLDVAGLVREKIPDQAHTSVAALSLFPQLADILKRELSDNKLERVFFDIELPLIPILAEMEQNGILLDKQSLAVFSEKLANVLAAREEHIYALAGTRFNINSPKQLGELLFGTLGIADAAVRKTGGGAKSTRASELVKLRGAHPIIEELLAWREEVKLKTTYVDVFPKLTNPETGRIHAEFNQTGAVTGRLSSQNPNMQNIPVRTPLGQEMRRAFVAPAGYVLVSCDYSQIELRLAAHLAGDERMIETFRAGKDIHTATAAAVNHVGLEQVTPAMRRNAKTINFGILYGMGAVSLSESLGITRREANDFIQAYFEEFPRVKAYLSELKQQALERGYVETLFGRRRYFHNMANMGFQARREAERMAINAPIQGSGADIIKVAMIRVHNELANDVQKGDVRMLLQVHDELLFEIRKEEVALLSKRVQAVMENVCDLAVPLKVDTKEGPNWQDMA